MREFDDVTLVQKARDGDKVAFGELVTRHQHYVYRIVCTRVPNREDAEDLAQETFCKAFLRLKQIREPNKFKSWLRQVAANICSDWLRNRSNERQVTEPLEDSEQATLDEQSLQSFEDTITLEGLWDAINSLSEINRDAVIMHYFDGLTYQEISEELGIPVSTVRSRLQEARGNLRINLSAAVATLNLEQLRAPADFVQRVMEAMRHLSPLPKGNIGRLLPGILIGFLTLATVLFFAVRYQAKRSQRQIEEPPRTNNPLLFDDFEDGDYTANPLWSFHRDVGDEHPESYEVVETDGSLAFKLVEFAEQSASAWVSVFAQDFIFSIDVKTTRPDAIWAVSVRPHIGNFNTPGIQILRLQYYKSKFLLIGGFIGPNELRLDSNESPEILEDGRFHHYEVIRQNGRIRVKRDGEIVLSGEDLAAGQSVGAIILSGTGDNQGDGVGAYFDNVMIRAIER